MLAIVIYNNLQIVKHFFETTDIIQILKNNLNCKLQKLVFCYAIFDQFNHSEYKSSPNYDYTEIYLKLSRRITHNLGLIF